MASTAERISELEKGLSDARERVESIEMEWEQLGNALAPLLPLLPLLRPGSPVGDLLAEAAESPENTDEIIAEVMATVMESMMEGVAQHAASIVESHGLNPRPAPTLYASYMKGFNANMKVAQ